MESTMAILIVQFAVNIKKERCYVLRTKSNAVKLVEL